MINLHDVGEQGKVVSSHYWAVRKQKDATRRVFSGLTMVGGSKVLEPVRNQRASHHWSSYSQLPRLPGSQAPSWLIRACDPYSVAGSSKDAITQTLVNQLPEWWG